MVLPLSADDVKECIQVLQVVGVDEDFRPGGTLHGQLDEACEHATAALVVAQEGPKRLLTCSF